MLRNDNKTDVDVLAPYPEPTVEEGKLVHRVEVFANTLKTITRGFEILISPATFLTDKIKNKITKRRWKERSKAVPHDEQPPSENEVHVAKRTQALNKNFFFILKNGRIWFKPIGALDNTWMLLGPDGLPDTGVKLKAISSDDDNLIAIDEDNLVYYVHTDGIEFVLTKTGWKLKKIRLEWTDKWFAMPIVKNILGLVKSGRLTLPKDCIAFAISRKGPETGYYTDIAGKNNPEFLVGVTTLYALTKDGRIFFADPWMANGFWNEITGPEDGQFIAENLAAAASTIFLIRRDANGNAVMYTRFADFDSIGMDTFLPATYDPDNCIPLVRCLPGEDWLRQPDIILEKQARLTSEIAVLQIGRGQCNRQLRVEGTNANGEAGYYYKRIYEAQWHFEVTPGQTLVFTDPPSATYAPPPPINRPGDYFVKKDVLPLVEQVELKKFLRHGLSERGLHTTIDVTLENGKTLTLPLYARSGLAHIFGKREALDWTLTMPEKYKLENDPETKKALKFIFKNKSNISVKVKELSNGDIEVSNKCSGFKFAFKTDASSPFSGVLKTYCCLTTCKTADKVTGQPAAFNSKDKHHSSFFKKSDLQKPAKNTHLKTTVRPQS